MNRLNYSHLFYFQTIAKEGSIKSACQRLHVTQPTMSDQLKSLEEFLGKQLFERRNRQLFLNENGRVALEYANKIFALGNEMTRRIMSGSKEGLKAVSIGIEPSLSRTFTYRLLIPVLESKDIQIKIEEDDLNILYVSLGNGLLDFVLTDNYDPSKGYASVSLGISKYYAVGGKKFASAAEGFPDSLKAIPFFNFTKETRIRHEIDHYFLSKQLYPKTLGEADNLDFLRVLTQKNRCFTILPENFVRESLKEKKLFLLGEIEDLKTRVHAIYNPNTTNAAVQDVIQHLRGKKTLKTDKKANKNS